MVLLVLQMSAETTDVLCRYENFVGLTEVKAAQARVVECEKKFIETQEMRREAQKMIADVQKRIKVELTEVFWEPRLEQFLPILTRCVQDIHLELEKTHRGEDRYLVLVTQEHQVQCTGTWCWSSRSTRYT